jgi:protein phosphatase
MRVDWALATDRGRVRNQNEDSAIIREADGLAVLCDGMGGHLAGEVASRIGVTAFVESVGRREGPVTLRGAAAAMVSAVRSANEAIHQAANASPDHAGMGCTLVALRLIEGRGVYVSVGDSRLYRLRAGRLAQVTEDHTRLRMLARLGVPLDSGEARMLRGVLTRALGTSPAIDVDYGEIETAAGDVWLLCSDGLTDELEDEAICAILTDSKDAREIAGRCVTGALKAGGRDNVTVVIARVIQSETAGDPDGAVPAPSTDPAPTA